MIYVIFLNLLIYLKLNNMTLRKCNVLILLQYLIERIN